MARAVVVGIEVIIQAAAITVVEAGTGKTLSVLDVGGTAKANIPSGVKDSEGADMA